MEKSSRVNLYVALIHYPVVNKNGDVIASAITNLDLHDIARVAKTYAVARFYVVTPLADQKILTERIVSHWQNGAGAGYNPHRQEALALITVVDSLADVISQIKKESAKRPTTIATCARHYPQNISFATLGAQMRPDTPYVLILGTAWGLAEEIISRSDYVLEPIRGVTGYNHLSVRSAAAIMLDRLAGK